MVTWPSFSNASITRSVMKWFDLISRFTSSFDMPGWPGRRRSSFDSRPSGYSSIPMPATNRFSTKQPEITRALDGRDGMGSRADADPRYLMRSRASRRNIRRRRRRASGEPDGEGRYPLDLVRNGNVATMADDETLAQREAQAGPFPLAFRRHKRLQ